MSGNSDDYIKSITDIIAVAIGSKRNESKASCLNVKETVRYIRMAFAGHSELSNVKVTGALYDVRIGEVDFTLDMQI